MVSYPLLGLHPGLWPDPAPLPCPGGYPGGGPHGDGDGRAGGLCEEDQGGGAEVERAGDTRGAGSPATIKAEDESTQEPQSIRQAELKLPQEVLSPSPSATSGPGPSARETQPESAEGEGGLTAELEMEVDKLVADIMARAEGQVPGSGPSPKVRAS